MNFCVVKGCVRVGKHKPEGCRGLLCKRHRDEWLRCEIELEAELERVRKAERELRAGMASRLPRLSYAGLYGIERARRAS